MLWVGIFSHSFDNASCHPGLFIRGIFSMINYHVLSCFLASSLLCTSCVHFFRLTDSMDIHKTSVHMGCPSTCSWFTLHFCAPCTCFFRFSDSIDVPNTSVHLGCLLTCATCSCFFGLTDSMDIHKTSVHVGCLLICTRWHCPCILDVIFPSLFPLDYLHGFGSCGSFCCFYS